MPSLTPTDSWHQGDQQTAPGTTLIHSQPSQVGQQPWLKIQSAQWLNFESAPTGSTLESHLRGLCAKFNVSVELIKADGTTAPKKAESMNSDLASANAFSKLDQKSVTAWLDLRNKAAHGKYAEYQVDQVSLMLAGIRDFVSRTGT